MVEQDLGELAPFFGAELHVDGFKRYQGLNERDEKRFKSLHDNPRIYPNYFAPIAVMFEGRRLITPMCYRLRPQGSNIEVPSKYNVFNARLDSLETRATWKPLFGVQHGLLGLKGFYEWVEDEQGKKKVIRFFPETRETLATPVLFDMWVAADGSEAFASFAVITTDPPKEVEEAGHDRCPIFLKEDQWQAWLDPKGKPRIEMKAILQEATTPHLLHAAAEP